MNKAITFSLAMLMAVNAVNLEQTGFGAGGASTTGGFGGAGGFGEDEDCVKDDFGNCIVDDGDVDDIDVDVDVDVDIADHIEPARAAMSSDGYDAITVGIADNFYDEAQIMAMGQKLYEAYELA